MATERALWNASPAEASSLIRPDEISKLISGNEERQSKRPQNAWLTTRCPSVDEALEGRLENGIRGLCCISGERGAGKTRLALAFLASHLLANPRSNAAIIDTSGNFDVFRLHATLISRLQRDVVPQHQEMDVTSSSSQLDEAANKVLERVRIMRVFDFVGVKEAFEEVKEEISRAAQNSGSKTSVLARPRKSGMKASRKEEVADSEDELSEDEDVEEMLFVGMSGSSAAQARYVKERPLVNKENSADEAGGSGWMLIVDNITQVMSPLMKVKYVQAHAMLASFMRDLAQLARSHDLISLLVNSGITRHATVAPAPGLRTDGSDAASTLQNYFTLSAFEACTTYPALGKAFPFLVDMHVLVARLPKEKRDAGIYYKSPEKDSNGHYSKDRKVEMVHMVEVLSDAWDRRANRLAAFQCKDPGGLETVVYESHM